MALAAGRNIQRLSQQIKEFQPQVVSVADDDAASKLSRVLKKRTGKSIPEILVGESGMTRVATHPDVDMVVSAAVGVVGLVPTFEAVRCGKAIALANKEVLVAAGELIFEQLKRGKTSLLPVDSEHCAIHQCLRSGRSQEVRRLILTASGGPFRSASVAAMRKASVRQALAHPTWRMGDRITIDSATLMNKGLEVIEARWLFELGADEIDVLIHPQSTIHSMVEFIDGSIIAQLSATDMRQPIQYALTYPERLNTNVRYFDFGQSTAFDFEKPDRKKFRCLALAYEALKSGSAATCALNAADEVAVQAFLHGSIALTDIPIVIEKTLNRISVTRLKSIEHCGEIDARSRSIARAMI